MSKKSLITVLVILFLVALPPLYVMGLYNGMVSGQEGVTRGMADIDTQLRRRADLIPNLINTVKGYMDHEKAAIASVTQARENMLGA